jgi:hypothetical protein
MGEIKSTYDIVMEKAKGITVTEDEKKEFRMQEIRRMVRRYFQKSMDGVLNGERIRKEIEDLDPVQREMARELFREEGAERFELQADNGPLIEILQEVLELDTLEIENALALFVGEYLKAKEGHGRKLIEKLKERGISGPAIVPNLNADPAWKKIVFEMEERLRSEVKSMI